MKAWKVTITSWPDIKLLVFAKTSGKARYQVKLNIDDAGWKIPFTNYRCVRANEFDYLATEKPKVINFPPELKSAK